ncbi:MAG TPA: hypothetical protein VFI34_07610 [Candidatus Limnocylindrales bacterium]|nr:hypothetical protein [Candidatus Limnocylindrales bacterium]
MTPGEGDQGAANGAGTASGQGAAGAGAGQGGGANAAQGGAAGGDAGAAGSAGAGAGAGTAGGDAGGQQLDAAAAQRELEAARKEAAKYRTELQKLKDDAKAAADAKLSDDEKRAKDLADKEAALQARELKSRQSAAAGAIVAAAAAQGVPSGKLELVKKLLVGDVEYDDEGEPKNIAKLVGDLLKDHPDFKGTGGAGAGSADGGARGKTTLTKDDIKKMSPDEINKRWPEIQEVLARG